jgi:succinoglycan biosynthesis transport protein ExoP
MTASDDLGRLRGDDLTGVLSVLRRRWPVLVGVVAACVLAAVVRHSTAPKSYAATSNVAFQIGTLPDAALQVNRTGSGDPVRDADTEVLIANSPQVAQGVRRELGTRASASDLLHQVSVEAAPNADVLNITAKSGDPRSAAQLANSFADQYIAFKAASQMANISSAQAQLQRQIAVLLPGPTRNALQQSLQRLSALRAVASGGAQIIGRAGIPRTPAGTKLSTSIIIGVLIGLALGFSLVFLLESLDRRIKSTEEFEREYRLGALTGVPASAFRGRRGNEAAADLLEPYRILRSALDFAAVTRQLDTLLVTSAVPGEGKTTAAVGLARAIALTGRRVVLVELDLRRPTFAQHFNLDPAHGLTTALTGTETVSEMLVEPLLDLPNLSVLPSGRLPPNPSELLGSPRITEVLNELVTSEGIVIIDTPPLNPVADTQVLLNNGTIHAVLVVARVNQTTRDEVRRARAILDRHMIDPVGMAVTGLRDADGYRYGYDAYEAVEPTLDANLDVLSRPTIASARRRLPF